MSDELGPTEVAQAGRSETGRSGALANGRSDSSRCALSHSASGAWWMRSDPPTEDGHLGAPPRPGWAECVQSPSGLVPALSPAGALSTATLCQTRLAGDFTHYSPDMRRCARWHRRSQEQGLRLDVVIVHPCWAVGRADAEPISRGHEQRALLRAAVVGQARDDLARR